MSSDCQCNTQHQQYSLKVCKQWLKGYWKPKIRNQNTNLRLHSSMISSCRRRRRGPLTLRIRLQSRMSSKRNIRKLGILMP